MKNIENIIDGKRTENAISYFKGKENQTRKKINQLLKGENLMYNGKESPLCFNPVFLNANIKSELNSISKNFSNLLGDFMKLLSQEKNLIKDIINTNHSYKLLEENIFNTNPQNIKNMFYRLDGIIANNQIKIIEANIDSPGGTLTLEKYAKIISEKIYPTLSKNLKKLKFGECSEDILNHFVEAYKNFCKDKELFLVIGDRDDPGRFEHKLWAKKLRQQGIPARTADYRDNFQLNEKGLYHNNKKVGIIYKRVFPINQRKDIITAERNKQVKVLNPLVSILLENKALFALFHELKNTKLKNYQKFIEENITPTFLMSGFDKKELSKNKDNYVVKESDVDCGRGVYIGKAELQSDWNKKVSNFSNKCVVQRYYEQPEMMFIDNKVEGIKLRKFDFNLFCRGNKVTMPYIRVNAEKNYKSNIACGASNGLCFYGGKDERNISYNRFRSHA